MGIGVVAKNHLQPPKTMFLPENYNLKAPELLYGLIFIMPFAYHSHVICMHQFFIYMYSYAIRMSLVCHSYVTCMYSCVIRMSLVCTRMLSVCYSYVLICHPYFTRMYSYVIRMSLVTYEPMNHEPILSDNKKRMKLVKLPVIFEVLRLPI